MTRSNSLRSLTLAAILALGAPLTVYAAPGSVGNSAVPTESLQSIPVTRGAVNTAENTGNAAQADGNALATQVPVSQMAAGNSGTRVGNGASASDDFGIGAQG